MRTAYRCEKQPTGGLNRDSLINHINEEGINAPEKEENVPFELGKKRGKGRLQNNLYMYAGILCVVLLNVFKVTIRAVKP